ncbi:MAG: hypothetical protein AAF572_26505 [Cyanobacteria bacterium P01_B01_bin.77]
MASLVSCQWRIGGVVAAGFLDLIVFKDKSGLDPAMCACQDSMGKGFYKLQEFRLQGRFMECLCGQK